MKDLEDKLDKVRAELDKEKTDHQEKVGGDDKVRGGRGDGMDGGGSSKRPLGEG